jgi:ubiquitin C-terminal hydrolase
VNVIKDGIVNEGNVDDMTPESFMTVELSLKPEPGKVLNIMDCIRSSLLPERIEGFVDKDGNQKERMLRYWSLPKILPINLKRYDSMGRKIRNPVVPDETVDLSEFVIGYSKHNNYELFGAGIHLGSSIHGGHYIAIIKAKDGCWYCFNDTQVNKIAEVNEFEKVRPQLSNASCFFYRKK